jgi:hypothetical protein
MMKPQDELTVTGKDLHPWKQNFMFRNAMAPANCCGILASNMNTQQGDDVEVFGVPQ